MPKFSVRDLYLEIMYGRKAKQQNAEIIKRKDPKKQKGLKEKKVRFQIL